MKQTILILTVLLTIISNTYADITLAQVDKYLKISRAGEIIKLDEALLEKQFYQRMNLNKKDAKLPIQIEFQSFLNSIERVEICKNNFLKLNRLNYKKIIKFYKSDIGQKYAKAYNKFGNMTRKDMEKKYIELKENGTLYDKKEDIIRRISEQSNFINSRIKLWENTVIFTTQTITLDLQYRMQKRIEEYQPIFMGVIYAKFSEDELLIILNSIGSILKNETIYINNLVLDLSKYNIITSIKNFERWKNIRLCQEYTLDSESYPKFCNEEWLSKE